MIPTPEQLLQRTETRKWTVRHRQKFRLRRTILADRFELSGEFFLFYGIGGVTDLFRADEVLSIVEHMED
jgi:hypothetical protein